MLWGGKHGGCCTVSQVGLLDKVCIQWEEKQGGTAVAASSSRWSTLLVRQGIQMHRTAS
jgi:hypothetical protein